MNSAVKVFLYWYELRRFGCKELYRHPPVSYTFHLRDEEEVSAWQFCL
jgi:hypothetical protein